MQPVIPHIISECLTNIGEKTDFDWPDFDKKYLDKKELNIVVQINGKKRGLVISDKNTDEKLLINGLVKL